MPGTAWRSAPTTRRMAGTAEINRNTRKNPQRPHHREKLGGRHQRDGDHHGVEVVPGVAEEVAALPDQLEKDLDHEDTEDHPVGEVE